MGVHILPMRFVREDVKTQNGREAENHTIRTEKSIKRKGELHMAKIDTTLIEGYADMTPEQKLAALEALEIADPDYSGYVKKETFDKTASELAKAKKDILAKMTEDERAKQEREEELQRLREQNAQLESLVTIAKYKGKLLDLGYDDKLATAAATAWAEGDFDKVMSNHAAFLTAHDNKLKADMLGEMPTPPAGSGTKTVTQEDIWKIEDEDERVKAISEHLDLFTDVE